MAIVCEKAEQDDLELLDKVVRQYHPKLLAAEVRIGIAMLMDVAEDPKRPIKAHGVPALARVRRLNARDRMLTGKTITIEIDSREWAKMSEAQQIALLDHELTHVIPSETRGGHFEQHVDEHPMVLMKPDDYTINGFFEVARRHGRNSPEVRSLERVLAAKDDSGQLWLPFDVQIMDAGGELHRPGDSTGVLPRVSTVEFSTGGKTVKLTGKQFDQATDAILNKKPRRRAASG